MASESLEEKKPEEEEAPVEEKPGDEEVKEEVPEETEKGGEKAEEDVEEVEEEVEEEEETPKKAKKKKKKEATTPATTPVSERPTRERKVVERYSAPDTGRSSGTKPLSIEKVRALLIFYLLCFLNFKHFVGFCFSLTYGLVCVIFQGSGTQLKDIPNGMLFKAYIVVEFV